MVNDQLSLLDIDASPQPADAPRCRMCARPARWLTTQQQHAMYCAGKACSNRDRLCQQCTAPFTIGVDGAGTKYCSTKCKLAGYHPRPDTPAVTCAWCAKPRTRGGQQTGLWPYICQECIDPIRHLVDRLKRHKVPHDRARQLLDDPGCDVCGTDIIARARDAGTGKMVAQLVVDHDHGCCPGQVSCGRCVRGLLCNHCNIAAGMLRNSPEAATALASYLARTTTSDHNAVKRHAS